MRGSLSRLHRFQYKHMYVQSMYIGLPAQVSTLGSIDAVI